MNRRLSFPLTLNLLNLFAISSIADHCLFPNMLPVALSHLDASNCTRYLRISHPTHMSFSEENWHQIGRAHV